MDPFALSCFICVGMLDSQPDKRGTINVSKHSERLGAGIISGKTTSYSHSCDVYMSGTLSLLCVTHSKAGTFSAASPGLWLC